MIEKNLQDKIDNLYLSYNPINIRNIAEKLDLKYQETLLYIKNKKLKEIKQIQQKNELIYLIKEKKLTRKQIANKLKISPEKVTSYIEKYNIPADFRIIRKGKNEEAVLNIYNQNPISISDMSKTLNFSYSLVKNIYRKYDLKNIRTQKKKYFLSLTEDKYNSILVDLKTTSLSLEKIAKRYNVSRQRIFQIQKDNNIIRK